MAVFMKEIDTTVFSDDRHHQLYQYWLSKCAARPMPARRDLDPGDIPALLSCLILIEVHHTPLRYKVRLTGTEVDTITGLSLKGHWADDFPNSASVIDRFTWLVKNRKPYYVEDRLRYANKELTRYSCLVLPLSSR